ncbi:TldD/PmbA family protein [Phaeovibrio sulfidiphilus]|uniref:TldD/PmbA family protein n=1 Tax=Phaeovibrio sulfidiphilus TaxID=1220600 RepID=UPI003083FDDD
MSDSKATQEQALGLLDDLVHRAVRAGADAADAVLIDGTSLSLAVRKGALEKLEQAEGGDIGLRVLVGTRQALVSSADRSGPALSELVDRALAMARAVPEDPLIGLAEPGQIARSLPDIDGAASGDVDQETLRALALDLENAARSVEGVTNSEGAEASFSRSMVSLVASNGFAQAYPMTRIGMGVAVIAGDSTTGMEFDYATRSTVHPEDLVAPADLGREAGEGAVRKLGARRMTTGERTVVFDPRTARSLLGHFLSAINGSSIVRGTSFLKDALGTAVFGSGVSIVEDPLRRRGLLSRPCDAEGLPTRSRTLVENGVLTTWLLDLRSARALGMEPTGHASRSTGSAPHPAPSNVWLAPGPLSPEELIADIRDGLYVTSLAGQGVNSLTGDYSRGASGFRIENGVLTTPVHEITVAGNLRDMFAALTPASDLAFHYGTDAPTVRIERMMVAGEQA